MSPVLSLNVNGIKLDCGLPGLLFAPSDEFHDCDFDVIIFV